MHIGRVRQDFTFCLWPSDAETRGPGRSLLLEFLVTTHSECRCSWSLLCLAQSNLEFFVWFQFFILNEPLLEGRHHICFIVCSQNPLPALFFSPRHLRSWYGLCVLHIFHSLILPCGSTWLFVICCLAVSTLNRQTVRKLTVKLFSQTASLRFAD